MGQLKIHWSAKALHSFDMKALWYRSNSGSSFAKTFSKNIQKTANTIASMPTIGKKTRMVNGIQYYTFVSHPLSILYYHFDGTDLYVDDIRFTQMQN